MRHTQGHPIPVQATEELRLRMAEWRRAHKAPAPFPGELWAQAVQLAIRLGIGPTARALRLDHARLKRRVLEARAEQTPSMQAPAVIEKASTFVEWVVPASDTIPECALEVESSRGGRLRIQLKNLAPVGLATILREFVG